MTERGEDYGDLYEDLDVRRILENDTDPSEDSQDGLLGIIIEAPTTVTGGAALAATNSSSKGREEERRDSDAYARGCLQIMTLDLVGRPLFQVIPFCPKRADAMRTHTTSQALVLPTQAYDSDLAGSPQGSLNPLLRPGTIATPVKHTHTYTQTRTPGP